MQIGLFGGSFNPPHVCHLLATVWTYETHGLDEIWWLPTHEHAFDKDLEAFEHRWRMCERAVAPYPFIRVDEIERELEGRNHTIDTVRELQRRRPDDDFALVVGSDILRETDAWKQWDELVERVELIVVGRERHRDDGEREGNFALPDISSTRAREALEARDRAWLEQWIPADVFEYVEREDLYKPS